MVSDRILLLKRILEPIVRHMEHFLIHEMKIETVVEGEYRSGDKFFLKKYTTMIGVGGTLNLLFYVTYDESLLDHLTYKFAYGHVLDHEFQALRESAAGEIANTVIGHAISDFPDKGKGVAITPPVTIEDAKCINTHATQMLTVLVSTPYGNIELNVIGSSDEDQQC